MDLNSAQASAIRSRLEESQTSLSTRRPLPKPKAPMSPAEIKEKELQNSIKKSLAKGEKTEQKIKDTITNLKSSKHPIAPNMIKALNQDLTKLQAEQKAFKKAETDGKSTKVLNTLVEKVTGAAKDAEKNVSIAEKL